jgi:hypothetical protein
MSVCKTSRRKKVNKLTEQVFDILEELNVKSWENFKDLNNFEHEILNTLVKQGVKDDDLVEEVWFKVRFNISTKKELYIYLRELESEEKYEKCKKVLNKIMNV